MFIILHNGGDSLQTIVDELLQFVPYFFRTTSTQSLSLGRLVNTILAEPLFMAVIAMFFAGFIVSIVLRIFHTV